MKNEQNLPSMVTINKIVELGLFTEYTLRKMIKEGTLPTKVLKVGGKILINLDLLIENLNKVD